ncbi:hypothetical protein PSU4_40420 [Pseudonocardia sulfidoxydans NBRC 16205]|uniref:AB hydrolase-1 domain-containing protein n=2 Tax=Pseudonocardia sulfidoxydans TaxID=54011 RepID=A0A511DPW1_9PSEU|nr:hypothetical protein PSU4_40420 [Pseudonocardia sulfidoxydans NBRC 16205]
MRGGDPQDSHTAHAVICGEEHRDTLVVVPGRHANAAVLVPLLEVLATRYRVIAVDLPGEAGLGSGGRPNTERLRHYGEWFDQVLATAATDREVTVLAHGFGATVALAARPAPHVAGLVLLGPNGVVRPAVRPAAAAALARWRLAPTAASAERLLARLGGRDFVAPHALVEWMCLVGRHVAMSSQPPADPELARAWAATPCTVAVGEQDPLFGDGRLDRAVRSTLRTSVLTVPDVGALMPFEDPSAVLAVLRHHETVRPHPIRWAN